MAGFKKKAESKQEIELMNKIFGFLDYNSFYRRCIVASIAHAIMVGKYDCHFYSEEDAKKYWGNYYEMDEAQYKIIEDMDQRIVTIDWSLLEMMTEGRDKEESS